MTLKDEVETIDAMWPTIKDKDGEPAIHLFLAKLVSHLKPDIVVLLGNNIERSVSMVFSSLPERSLCYALGGSAKVLELCRPDWRLVIGENPLDYHRGCLGHAAVMLLGDGDIREWWPAWKSALSNGAIVCCERSKRSKFWNELPYEKVEMDGFGVFRYTKGCNV